MKTYHIPYEHTHILKPIVLDYLYDKQKMESFYQNYPSLDNFDKMIENKEWDGDRNLLSNTFKEQYADINLQSDSNCARNIELLKYPNTFTVTTGHQLCLLTGPLYFIFKLLSTIKLADILRNRHPNYNFVPIFWMATEDHDYKEINHINVFGKEIKWEQDTKGATGKITTQNIDVFFSEIEKVFGIMDIQPLKDIYNTSKNLADATRGIVHFLFGKYGLLAFDADNRKSKSQFIDVMIADITQRNSYSQITKTNARLKSLHLVPQATEREINFFYLADNLRERLVWNGTHYHVLNTDISFTEKELVSHIHTYPERFSPNVLIRPLYQEKLLPNLAYLGGGAEIAYWLQLKSTFDYYKIEFPILMLRNSAMLIDDNVYNKWQKLGFELSDLFQDINHLINDWIQKNAEVAIHLDDEKKLLSQYYNSLKLRIGTVDKTLTYSIDAELKKALDGINHIENKVLKAQKNKFEVQTNQIRKIKDKLFPNGILQERVDNFLPFYLKNPEYFTEILYSSLNPFSKELCILIY